mmetsp:Transcript_15068/g.41264  ORF Transcript_15068/g.41264 Transcript_15068/m.41264 type:complete len:96 (+) Transcript_15068:25-312(+)
MCCHLLTHYSAPMNIARRHHGKNWCGLLRHARDVKDKDGDAVLEEADEVLHVLKVAPGEPGEACFTMRATSRTKMEIPSSKRQTKCFMSSKSHVT